MNPDEDFLLEAYQEYLNEVEEWPNFKNLPEVNKYTGSTSVPMPLLIRECARLVPEKNKETGYISFHPFNMPKVTIRCIQIVGTIVGLSSNATYKHVEVYDGTGTIMVIYKLQTYEADLMLREEIDCRYGISPEDVPKFTRLMKQNIVDNGRGNPSVERRKQLRHILTFIIGFQQDNESWWEECHHGMLGNPLEIGSYVNVHGFCSLKSNKFDCTNGDDSFWDSFMMPLMVFKAYDIKTISEKQYNDTLDEWVNGIVKMKYTAD